MGFRSPLIANCFAAAADRSALRRRLLAERERFVGSSAHPAAADALAQNLLDLLEALEPESLGLYWPVRSEFNAATAVLADKVAGRIPLALPFARRAPHRMEYRRWDGTAPALHDECGIPTSAGSVVVPDVVLVPCVGFTADGYRLGYGGGFFDRWLADHSGTAAVGVAWSFSELPASDFAALPHDRPLTVVVTERGAVA